MNRAIASALLGAAAAVLSVAPAFAYDWTIANSSKWDIHQVFISSCGDNSWGRDRLGSSSIMHTGDSYVLSNVGGGCYDVKLVDEDGDVCVVPRVQVNDDLSWTVTDNILLRCESSN